MLGSDDNPLRRRVGVVAQDMDLQGQKLGGEELETEAKLLGAFGPTLPAIMRSDGTIYLHAGCKVVCDDAFGQFLGLGAGGDRGPGDKHAVGSDARGGAASREISP